MDYSNLFKHDDDVSRAIKGEFRRERDGLEMIPSENYCPIEVMEAMGSVFANKYSEGYPGARYYGGQEFTDMVESIAIERAKKLFGAEHANVQPESGSPANMAAYAALLDWGNSGRKILGMRLDMGGHLTHGHLVNFSGRLLKVFQYGVVKETGYIDYDDMRKQALANKPQVIVAGATAYPREYDFKRFKEIADECDAYFMADIAHIAGLIVAGVHQDPVPLADMVTSTTHKTLRGPRGGLILCKEEHAKAVDRAVFPGLQGGPHEHTIAAKAVAFGLDMKPEFKEYGKQIVSNCKALADSMMSAGMALVSGGTDNHLILADVTSRGVSGKEAETLLDSIGITVNKNMIPYDTRKPVDPSGIRLGTPALTTRGMKESEMKHIGEIIVKALDNHDKPDIQAKLKQEVLALAHSFPLYQELRI